MKKTYLLILVIIIQAIFLFGCGIIESNLVDEKNIEANEMKLVEDENFKMENNIVFICNRQQHNDNYYNLGYFIDSCGNKCYFDLSSDSVEYANINNLYEYLIENLDQYERIAFLDKEQLYNCFYYLNLVDENAEVTEECAMVDYGTYFLYGIRLSESGEKELILLEEYGDWNRINTDKNVNNIIEIIGKDTWRDNL